MYEWDEGKRRANIEKHGIDFTLAETFEWETALVAAMPRAGEARWTALGYIGDRLHVVACTWRGARLRIISLRKANRREERRYAEA